MAKSERRPVNLKLSLPEFEALAADAAACSIGPTTLALCACLAGLQRSRQVVPDLFAPATRGASALEVASSALRDGGNTSAADAAQAAAEQLRRQLHSVAEGSLLLVEPGWRLAAYRHRIVWTGPGAGRPDLGFGPSASPSTAGLPGVRPSGVGHAPLIRP